MGADAILDRLVHNAYKITLQGESMRKRQAMLTKGADQTNNRAPGSLRFNGSGFAWRKVATFL